MPSYSIRETIPRGRPSSAIVLAGLVVLVTLAGLASSASAEAANGVFFDPNSPAGKEYALPLDQARNEATSGEESGEDSASGAPLFGAGVSPPGSATRRSSERDEKGGHRANGRAGHEAQRGSTPNAAAVVRISEAGDGYPLTSSAAMVAAIMLLGGALGLAFRGLQRRMPSA